MSPAEHDERRAAVHAMLARHAQVVGEAYETGVEDGEPTALVWFMPSCPIQDKLAQLPAAFTRRLGTDGTVLISALENVDNLLRALGLEPPEGLFGVELPAGQVGVFVVYYDCVVRVHAVPRPAASSLN